MKNAFRKISALLLVLGLLGVAACSSTPKEEPAPPAPAPVMEPKPDRG